MVVVRHLHLTDFGTGKLQEGDRGKTSLKQLKGCSLIYQFPFHSLPDRACEAGECKADTVVEQEREKAFFFHFPITNTPCGGGRREYPSAPLLQLGVLDPLSCPAATPWWSHPSQWVPGWLSPVSTTSSSMRVPREEASMPEPCCNMQGWERRGRRVCRDRETGVCRDGEIPRLTRLPLPRCMTKPCTQGCSACWSHQGSRAAGCSASRDVWDVWGGFSSSEFSFGEAHLFLETQLWLTWHNCDFLQTRPCLGLLHLSARVGEMEFWINAERENLDTLRGSQKFTAAAISWQSQFCVPQEPPLWRERTWVPCPDAHKWTKVLEIAHQPSISLVTSVI